MFFPWRARGTGPWDVLIRFSLTLVNALKPRSGKKWGFDWGVGIMTAYRIYVLDLAGHVAGPPQIVECTDDQEAIRQARQCLDAKPIEVWDGAKRVGRVEPNE